MNCTWPPVIGRMDDLNKLIDSAVVLMFNVRTFRND